MSCCQEHQEQKDNHQNYQSMAAEYVCPMHPEVTSNKPDRCTKCGMDLVKKTDLESGEATHDHSSMMATPEAAREFMQRFIKVTFLLLPLIFLIKPVLDLVGLPDFFLRKYLQFGVATAIFYYALVFFDHARHEWMARKYGMMTLVSLAVGAGYLFSAASTFIPAIEMEFYLEISTLIWVLLFGHYLEAKSSSAAGNALQEVAKLLPRTAHLLKNGRIQDVDISELNEGDVVLLKPGEKVPADGEIVKGEANMDESLISGESKPVEKKKDDKVVAGSICLDGSLEVRLIRVGENSTIGQIQSLIAKAQKTKPSAQKIADKAANVLTFTALIVALLTVLVWTLVVGQTFVFAITLAITVLVIACPHALGLAIPTVSTISTTLAIRNGVFIKDMAKLEVVKKVDYVVFDKTGTLTKGKFGVSEVVPLGKTKPADILRTAASLETHSSHVIGQSIVEKAKKDGLKMTETTKFKNIAGKGIEGMIDSQKYLIGNRGLMKERKLLSRAAETKYEELSGKGKTTVFLADQKEAIGLLALSDVVKEESYAAVRKLHSLGVKVAMLTGDNEAVAKTVADELDIDTYFAEVLPEDKYKHIKTLQDEGNQVMMVGDGINDAPALTQADAGVAVGAGTEVAVEAGDIVLTRNNPEDIARLIKLSRAVYRKMVENLIWATGYNVMAIPAAAGAFAPLGFFLKPEWGAILMSLSSVIVVINALTLKKVNLEVKS